MKAKHMAPKEGRRWRRRTKVVAGAMGAVLAGGVAFAGTNWTVGLNSGSNGEAQSATVSNLTIAAIASPSATNLLYPGGTGDVVVTITNPNSFPVTITTVTLPANTTYAGGYTTSALSSAQTGCSSSTSDVAWSFAGASSGHVSTLTSPLTVAANGTLTGTFTNDASMTTSSPAACENTYFSMPSLVAVGATGGAGTATSGPFTDGWTS